MKVEDKTDLVFQLNALIEDVLSADLHFRHVHAGTYERILFGDIVLWDDQDLGVGEEDRDLRSCVSRRFAERVAIMHDVSREIKRGL